ncbi:MAG TPA: site-specific integrase [Methylotenera sp.]|nr:site-specific integrase [Methylotenera sp.]HPH04302.1 site-specific integrase [Methylotenera sp.]HPM99856.1 site-specific integrase [Methylotenera sp.]
MDRRQGINPRGKSIQIDFYYLGKRCRETLKLEPTKRNLTFAKRLKSTIQHEIAIGTFDYSKHFPESNNALLGSKISNKTVSQALDQFIESSRRRLEKSTWRDYYSSIEHHLKPHFGHMKLIDVTTTDIKTWIGGLLISNKRINNVLVPLRTVFNDAYSDGLIDRNPVTRITNLAVRTDEPQPFTPDEIKAILNSLSTQGANLIQFAIWTGLRTSELIALEWGDIDFKNNLIRVRRASVNKHTKQPKTRAGERDVKLFPPAIEALKNQKQFTFINGGRVFNNPRTNEPWETDGQIRKTMWIPALKKAGVIYRNPYQTRHTYASTLLSAGENPLWVASQMGHKDWGMIRKRYGRWIPDVDTSAGGKVMEFWSQIGHKDTVNA